MIYQGLYTSGQSGHAFTCEVAFNREHISITYTNAQGQNETVNWEPALLHPHYKTENHTHQFSYGNFPYQTLKISDSDLPAVLKQLYPSLPLMSNKQFSFFAWNKPFIIGLLLTVTTLVLLVWLVLLPWVARFALNHFPKEYEITMGEQMYKASIQNMQRNEAASKQMTLFLKTLIDSSEYPVQADVVHSKEVNAFALPGGHIVVYDGLLKKMHSYEELAALLGHEYSHVKLRHSTRNILRQVSVTALLYAVVGDINGLSAYVLQHAASLNNLQYSRDLEREADAGGFDLLQQKHIDAHGMLRLFETLKKENTAGVPSFLSTHPATDDRIEFINEKLAGQQHTQTHEELNKIFESIQQQVPAP
ncbi:MAG: M48 family metallopeptidase [Bacteroidia bacterium]|nr:M48 family metallopeptidase [Bacteroidia bacterium]